MARNIYILNNKTNEVKTLQFKCSFDFNEILLHDYDSQKHTVFLSKKDLKDFLNIDPHLGCYSYPNCDEAPTGCRVIMGKDVEPIGYRD